jgi:hypothetical protein
MPFTQAVKSVLKLRCAIFGPSGGGKTFSALRIAKGMGGRIALIDTEHGSSACYADRITFDVLALEDRTIAGYQRAIDEAAAGRYDVLIIDSLTHAWQELLEQVDKWGNGNNWAGWRKGGPEQKRLVESILSYPGHLIATMRVKTDWNVTTDDRGKTKPVKIGLAPEQGKGIEYEFSLLMEINPEHMATVTKDRTGKFQDRTIEKPGEEFGAELVAWLSTGVPAAPAPPKAKAMAPVKPDWTKAAEGPKPTPTPTASTVKPETPQAQREDTIRMLLDMAHGDANAAALALKGFTSFKGRDGKEFTGHTDVSKVSDKAAPVTWGKVHNAYKEWLASKAGAPVPAEPPATGHEADEAWDLFCQKCGPTISEAERTARWFKLLERFGANSDTFDVATWKRVVETIQRGNEVDPATGEQIPF